MFRQAGQWARRLCINDDLYAGSVINYISASPAPAAAAGRHPSRATLGERHKAQLTHCLLPRSPAWAQEHGLGVLILNPNHKNNDFEAEQHVVREPSRRSPCRVQAPQCALHPPAAAPPPPPTHGGRGAIECPQIDAWEQWVETSAAKHVVIVAHSYGAETSLSERCASKHSTAWRGLEPHLTAPPPCGLQAGSARARCWRRWESARRGCLGGSPSPTASTARGRRS